jgi:signal transduction histidine kinase
MSSARRPPAFDPEKVRNIDPRQPVIAALADSLETALWVYDFDRGRIVWANRMALTLWNADDVAALTARDLAAEMSETVRTRLRQHREDFAADPTREMREFWTLYPKGKPFRVRAALRRCTLGDGRIAMLVEARAEERGEPATIRSADALLHTQVITALFDSDGLELYANPAFRAAFGPGRHRFGMDFVHAADARPFHEAMIAGAARRATVRVRTVDGERWHDIHAARCRDAVTGDGAFLISASDVTEAREHQLRLAEALEAAEAADRAKSRFLATMSHELRTPLNGVLGMASLLRHGDLSAAQGRAVDLIARCGAEMLEMIEGMLDIVAIDSRAVRILREPFDPATLLRIAVESVRAEADRKRLSLVIDDRRLEPGDCVHDASRIRQVLRHLLVNAVKFTDSGEIAARAATVTDARGRRALRFEVSDTGPGVAVAERERIFERFHQADGSITRRHGGTGLGLAICREFVKLWDGSIGVSCGESGGSTFWFEAPLDGEAEQDEPPMLRATAGF